MAITIDELLTEIVERKGSDLHLKADRPPLMRISGDLLPSDHEPLSNEELEDMLYGMMSDSQRESFIKTCEMDMSYEVEDVARYRVNVLRQRGRIGAVIRMIPSQTPTIEDMGLPDVLHDLVKNPQGLILVTGPTGSGKSTTLASMVDDINHSMNKHIITIEDPIEFVYTDDMACVNQRELGADTLTLHEGLRRALRQDPDVILMGEMRDPETIEAAIHAAETGHLVFSTLHTNDAKQSVDRILDSFSAERIGQIRGMLALTLRGVISQRLVKKADGQGRTAVLEILINSPAVSELIEAGNTRDIEKAMLNAGEYYKMQTFNQALTKLVNDKVITQEIAMATSATPSDLALMLKGIEKGGEVDMSSTFTESEDASTLKPKLKLKDSGSSGASRGF